MKPLRTLALVATCALGTGLGWELARGDAGGSRRASRARPAPDRVSLLARRGRPVRLGRLTRLDRSMFEGGPALAHTASLVTVGNGTFYKLTRSDGSVCIAVGDSRTSGLFDLGMNCPSFRGQRLLSSSNPVALFSAVDARKPDVAFEPLTVVAGFATDAVAAVSVVGRDGRIYTTPSEHNVFFTTRLPRMGALEIRATDVFGRRVWGVRLARIFRGAPTRDGR